MAGMKGILVICMATTFLPDIISTQRLVVVVPFSVGVPMEGEGHVNVSLSVIGGEAAQHRVKLQLEKTDDSTTRGRERTVTLATGSLVPVLVTLPAAILSDVRASSSDATCRLVATSATTTNREETADMRVFLRNGFIFVQTDRPTYRRGETVHIRVLSTTEDRIPQGKELTIEITDSDNITKVTDTIPNSSPTYETSVTLGETESTGDWYVTVFHGQQRLKHSATRFRVVEKEPILHPFEMSLKIENHIVTRETSEITIHLAARESFGIPVLGRVETTISVIKDGKKMVVETMTSNLNEGKTQLSYKLSELYAISTFTFTNLLGSRLEVMTLVKDDTGRYRQMADRSVIFTEGVYKVSLSQLSLTRHPNVDFYPLEVLVTYYDDKPAMNTKVDVIQDGYTEHGVTDQHGYFYKELLRPTEVKVRVGNEGMKKVEKSFTVAESSEPQIRISPFRIDKKVGDTFRFTIGTPNSGGSWYYMVAARGKILQSGSSTDRNMMFHVEASMTPYVTVTVWAVYSNVTVTHTATITVTDNCAEKFKMAVVQNGNDLVDRDSVFPGSDITVQFTGDFQQVALQAVDSLAFDNFKDSIKYGLEIQDALTNRYSVDVPLVLGSSEIKQEVSSRPSRPRRSVKACTWTTAQCRQAGRRAAVSSLAQCLSHTYRVFSSRAACFNSCINAYYNSCTGKFKRVARSSVQRSVVQPIRVQRSIVEDDVGTPSTLSAERVDFRTSWLFDITALTEKDWFTDRHTVAARVPDSITKWYITAVGLTEGLPVCVARANITVKKSTFLRLHLPDRAKVGEIIDARATVYQIAAMSSSKKPRLRVDHPKGICHNWGSETTLGQRPWTTSWRLQPTHSGVFTVKVGYNQDRVRHLIQVKDTATELTHRNVAEISSSSKILGPREISKIINPPAPNEDPFYEYQDYDVDDYEYYDYTGREYARTSSRVERETGSNGDVHELHLTVKPKITMTKWNMSIELLTGFKLDTETFDQLNADHAYLQSYKESDGVLVLNMNRMEKGAETDIKFLISSSVNIPNRKDATISIHHQASTGPLVVHRYNVGKPQPVPQPPRCAV